MPGGITPLESHRRQSLSYCDNGLAIDACGVGRKQDVKYRLSLVHPAVLQGPGGDRYYPKASRNNDVRVVSTIVDERISTDASGTDLWTTFRSIRSGHKLGKAMGFEFENGVSTHLAGCAADGGAPHARAMQRMVVASRSFVAPRLLLASRFAAVPVRDAYITLTFGALVVAAFL